MQAVLDAAAEESYPAKVVAVGTDREGVQALDRAERAGVPSFTVKVSDYPTIGVTDSYGSIGFEDPGSVTVTVKGKKIGGSTGTEKFKSDFTGIYFSASLKGESVEVDIY